MKNNFGSHTITITGDNACRYDESNHGWITISKADITTGYISSVYTEINRKNIPTNCINCGAPLHSSKCEYCGSEY